ncbi:MAG: alpha-hydroxy-acid oxidizing protein, partial [Alphaproteobacteria bacterium]
TKGPFWFQLYMLRDRGVVKSMLERAHEAGVRVLIFTVDLAVVGMRYRDVRNGMGMKLGMGGQLAKFDDYLGHLGWVWNVGLRGRPLDFGSLKGAVKGVKGLSGFKDWVDKQFDPSFTWADLEWIRSNWPGQLIIKGIMDSDDARAAMHAVSPEGLVVSNHGGRQLDGVPAPLEVLPAIREAAGMGTHVLMDGGVRTGIDVLKAMARGADACLIGKSWAYAVAAGGEATVIRLLRTMQAELRVAMALTGVTRPDAIDGRVLASGPGNGPEGV